MHPLWLVPIMGSASFFCVKARQWRAQVFHVLPTIPPSLILRFNKVEKDWEGTRIFLCWNIGLFSENKAKSRTGILWVTNNYNQNRLSFLLTLHMTQIVLQSCWFAERMTIGKPENIY